MNESIVLQGTKPNGTRNFHPKGQTQFAAIFNSAKETAWQQQPDLEVSLFCCSETKQNKKSKMHLFIL